MKVIIIYAHPEVEGFNSEILKKVKAVLDSKNHDYEVWDLYGMNYDPVLKEEELYTAGNRKVSEENLKFQKKIKEASKVVFIYPIWWGGMPAILKGFMDRVFTSGFAFKYSKDKIIKMIPYKNLKDKTMVCLVSSGGPWIFYALILNPVKIINRFIVFGFFGAKSKTFQIYNARKLTDKKVKQINKIAKKGVNWMLRH